MTTSGKRTDAEPQAPRKKGGGDGKAKDATVKSEPAKARDEEASSGVSAEPGVRSRKITTPRG